MQGEISALHWSGVSFSSNAGMTHGHMFILLGGHTFKWYITALLFIVRSFWHLLRTKTKGSTIPKSWFAVLSWSWALSSFIFQLQTRLLSTLLSSQQSMASGKTGTARRIRRAPAAAARKVITKPSSGITTRQKKALEEDFPLLKGDGYVIKRIGNDGKFLYP